MYPILPEGATHQLQERKDRHPNYNGKDRVVAIFKDMVNNPCFRIKAISQSLTLALYAVHEGILRLHMHSHLISAKQQTECISQPRPGIHNRAASLR